MSLLRRKTVFAAKAESTVGTAEQSTTEAGGSTLRERYAAAGVFFEPAPGKAIDLGEREIIDLFDYNDDIVGQKPALYIHPRCQQLIDAQRAGVMGRSADAAVLQADREQALRMVELLKQENATNTTGQSGATPEGAQ